MLSRTVAVLALVALVQNGLAFDLTSLSDKLQNMAETGVPDHEVTKLLRLRKTFKMFNDANVDLPIFDGISHEEKLEVM
jgi:hypothetical protein